MSIVEKNRIKNRKYIEKLKAMPDEELLKELRELTGKDDLTIDQVYRGNYMAKFTNDEVCPYVVVLGYVNAANSKLKSLGDLIIVGLGDFKDRLYNQGLVLSNSQITDTGKVKKIFGSFSIDPLNKKIKSTGDIEYIGGNCYFNRTEIKNTGKIKEFGGIVSLDNSKITTLQGVEKVAKIYAHKAYNLQDWGTTLSEVGEVEFEYQPLTIFKRHNTEASLPIHRQFFKQFSRNNKGVFEKNKIKKELNVEEAIEELNQ